MRTGRPPGPAKLRLTAEVTQEIIRRVKLRSDAQAHSNSKIAADFGVTEAAVVGAITRLRRQQKL